ncbi:hypothetical protein Poly41_28140 [Novipirellula artificiosorum]|uniref:Uncharacterized protein n=1 Tax=Novipirellula artificiosorum TaxID=2528016 RepID=A0A5C6DNP2_9BACT|nr:hypothetical protein Poly41_28140 [Novipirellula artificiosorum]
MPEIECFSKTFFYHSGGCPVWGFATQVYPKTFSICQAPRDRNGAADPLEPRDCLGLWYPPAWWMVEFSRPESEQKRLRFDQKPVIHDFVNVDRCSFILTQLHPPTIILVQQP